MASYKLSTGTMSALIGSLAVLGLVVLFLLAAWRRCSVWAQRQSGLWRLDRMFHRLATSLFGEPGSRRDPANLEKRSEPIFKLIEAIKLVAVFLMALSPLTLLDYQCSLPEVLVGVIGDDGFCSAFRLPCNSSGFGSIWGSNAFRAFVSKISLDDSQLEALLDILDMRCKNYNGVYFGVVLFTESLSMLYFFLFSQKVLAPVYVVAHGLTFMLTALIWALWPIILGFEHNDGFYCSVRWAELTTTVVSIWHAVVAGILLFGAMAIANAPVAPTLVTRDDGKPNHVFLEMSSQQ